jgi:hypothetical protein
MRSTRRLPWTTNQAPKRASDAPGTLAKFHLGLAADGTDCAMVLVDEHQRSIACIASFSDVMGFVASLQRMAAKAVGSSASACGRMWLMR